MTPVDFVPKIEPVVSVIRDIGLWAFGVLTGAIGDFFLREPLLRSAAKLRRRLLSRRLGQRDTLDFPLASHATGVCLIEGNGAETIPLKNLTISYEDKYYEFPEHVAKGVEEIAAQYGDGKTVMTHSDGRAVWNGDTVHVTQFSCTRSGVNEDLRLVLSTQKAQYYQFMATAGILDAADRAGNLESVRKRFESLRSMKNWRDEKPPHDIVNGLPVNLLVLTSDNQLVFSRRSTKLAIAGGVISCAINENVHHDEDLIRSGTRKGELDLGNTIARGLSEELGCMPASLDGETLTKLLAFAVQQRTGAYSILGYIKLPITMRSLNTLFARGAKDRMETSELLSVPFTVDGVCRFIHAHNLYDMIGVCAALTLLNERTLGATLADVDNKLLALDRSRR